MSCQIVGYDAGVVFVEIVLATSLFKWSAFRSIVDVVFQTELGEINTDDESANHNCSPPKSTENGKSADAGGGDLEDGELTESGEENEPTTDNNSDARLKLKGRNMQKMYQKLIQEDPEEESGLLEDGEDDC